MTENADSRAETMTATTPTTARPRHIRRIVLIVIAVLIAIVVGLPFISLTNYHRTIAASLARSIGHPVYLGSVNLTAFPLPGLEIHNLIIEEDPAFGSEPLLVAPKLTVLPRLSSLWTGRLEISRISVDHASVNLVRRPGGSWNFSSLLLKASRSALAPTAQRHRGSAPRFPYISFSGARINFKRGAVKEPLSFLNADAAIWLSGSNRWRIRFKAQPDRTNLDIDLEDAGTVRLSGSLTRAASLDQLPLHLHAQWTGAQLGQASRMVLGYDDLWLGSLRAKADLTGSMNNLVLRARFHVSNLHRIEFAPSSAVSLDTRCQAVYHHAQRSLDKLVCWMPTGNGHLLLTGSIPQIGHSSPQLNLEINHTPAAFVLRYFGLLRRNLSNTLTASGDINGDFAWAQPGSKIAALSMRTSEPAAARPPKAQRKSAHASPSTQNSAVPNVLTGSATVAGLTLQLANADHPYVFPTLDFSAPTPAPIRRRRGRRGKRETQPAQAAILLQPAAVNAGTPAPMSVSGRFTRSGFHLNFSGQASIARLLPVARDVAPLRPLTALGSRGIAQTDLTFTSPWVLPVNVLASNYVTQGSLVGFAHIENAAFRPAWLGAPIVIAAATAQIGSGSGSAATAQVNWTNIRASVNGIAFRGSVSWLVHCANPAGCPAQLNLDFPAVHLAALTSTLTSAGRHNGFFQSILSHVESPTPWPALRADVHASVLTLGKLHLTNVSGAFAVQNHQLRILSLDAAALGGSLHASGAVQRAGDGPHYALNLTWAGVKVPEAAAVFHETWPGWADATVDGEASLHLHGYTQLSSSATGNFRWLAMKRRGRRPLAPFGMTQPVLRRGSASHSSAASWAAVGNIANGVLTLTQGPLRGAITFSRTLDLTTTAEPVRKITGTLARPLVTHPGEARKSTPSRLGATPVGASAQKPQR